MQTEMDTTRRYVWTPFFWAGLACVLVIFLFSATAESIIHIWSVSETFTHGYFVIPVFLWLLWRKRDELLSLPSQPDPKALLFIACAGLMWLLSRLAGIQVAEHLAFALILVFTLWAVLGQHIASKMKFPLLFLLFLAPVGEELVPVLMEITADMTVWAIRNTGIPIYREGLFFSLPSGNWSVVEACSGIRYLIASLVLGSIFAYLSYVSLRLRLVFIVISLVVPVFANSVRAFIIVMLGHFSGNKLATGVDHLIYGWLFFGVVMFALFSIGSWLQRFDSEAGTDKNKNSQNGAAQLCNESTGFGSYTMKLLVILAVVASWPAWSAVIDARYTSTSDSVISPLLLPHSQVFNAALPPESSAKSWQPRNSGHDFRLDSLFQNVGLPTVRAMAFVYIQQHQGKEMINSANVLVPSQGDPWRIASSQSRRLTLESGISTSVREYSLSSGSQRLTVWQWYRIGASITSNPMYAKLLEVGDRLFLRNNPSVNYMLVVDETATDKHSALVSAVNVIME